MDRRKGFTLIELIVAIAIMAIIMGALVQLFGTSVTHEITGFNQQEMYAQARRLENDLKNTLRYNYDNRYSGETLKFWTSFDKEITADDRSKADYIDKLKYNSIIYNNAKKCNQKIEVLIEWVDYSNKKQIKVVKKISDEKINDAGEKVYTGNTEERYVFPENIENSAFNGYFPVTVIPQEDNEAANLDIHSGMLKIKLPFRYKAAGGYKINELETKVALNEVNVSEGGTPGIIGLNNSSWWTYNNLKNFNSSSILAGPNVDTYNMFVLALKLYNTGFSGKLLISSNIYNQLESLYQYQTATDSQKQWILEHVKDKIDNKTLSEYIADSDTAAVTGWKIKGKEPYGKPAINDFTAASGLYMGDGLKFQDKTIVLNGETVAYFVVNTANLINTTISGKGTIILYEVNQGINIENLETGNDVKLILMSDSNRITIKSSVLNNVIVNARDSNLVLNNSTIGGIVYSKVNIDFSGNITLNGFPKNSITALEAGKAYFN